MRNLQLVIAAVVVIALGCSDGDNGPSQPNGDGENTVTVSNNLFTPSSLTVPVGTTVTWQWNSGGTAHTVTFDDGSFDSGSRTTGPLTRTFSTAGTFPYRCILHPPNMVGSVTVTAGTTGGTGGGGTGGGGGGGGGYP